MPDQEEVEEVEQKVAEAEHSRSAARRFLTRFCTPVFLEAFALTFLAGAPQLQPLSLFCKSCMFRHACVVCLRPAYRGLQVAPGNALCLLGQCFSHGISAG